MKKVAFMCGSTTTEKMLPPRPSSRMKRLGSTDSFQKIFQNDMASFELLDPDI
ncbi:MULTISPECIES: hypothetical protein [Chitinophagaceae]